MQYSIEESALIGGLITEYFSRASVSDSVRLAYRQVYQHLMDGHLTQDDLGQIQAALDFLLPVFFSAGFRLLCATMRGGKP